MPQSTRSQRLEERLWLLTGLLVGLALWLLTDRILTAVVVGVTLGLVLVSLDRTRRARGWVGSRSAPEARA